MKILALEPYYGGSHKSFLDSWVARSVHDWEMLTLPGKNWKWRMRMAAISFADEVNAMIAAGKSWDVLFCSDMLNLAEFYGLVDKRIRDIPSVVYFHENQLTYPNRVESDRDYQFVVTNMTTALAADSVWFNSEFHKNEFPDCLQKFIRKIPKERPANVTDRIRAKSIVQHPGIDVPQPEAVDKSDRPMQILWAARWEHDKNPEDFFAAIKQIAKKGVDFRLSVIGEHFTEIPEVFTQAKKEYGGIIDHWGFQPSRADYLAALQNADIVVSTAIHEFFGISMVEAIASGAYPLLPNRLSYPEISGGIEKLEENEFLFDGTVDSLVSRLIELSKRHANNNLWQNDPKRGIIAMNEYNWQKRADEMDKAIEKLK
jgi:glycosyltransferase involved in cell wall biosynthesis